MFTLPLPVSVPAIVRCRGLRANGRPCRLVLLREPWRSIGMGEDCAERAGLIPPRRYRLAEVSGAADLPLFEINEGDAVKDGEPLAQLADDAYQHALRCGADHGDAMDVAVKAVEARVRAEVAKEVAQDLADWSQRQRAQSRAAWNPQQKRDLRSYATAYDNAANIARRHAVAPAEGEAAP